MIAGLYARGHGQAMGNSWAARRQHTRAGRRRRWSATVSLERTTGLEPATPTLAISWWLSHASLLVSAAPLSCIFLALLSHASHQIAGVDSISLVISLVLRATGRLRQTSPTMVTTDDESYVLCAARSIWCRAVLSRRLS